MCFTTGGVSFQEPSDIYDQIAQICNELETLAVELKSFGVCRGKNDSVRAKILYVVPYRKAGYKQHVMKRLMKQADRLPNLYPASATVATKDTQSIELISF